MAVQLERAIWVARQEAVYRARRRTIATTAPAHGRNGTNVVPIRPDARPDSAPDDKEPQALLAAVSFGALLVTILISLALKLLVG